MKFIDEVGQARQLHELRRAPRDVAGDSCIRSLHGGAQRSVEPMRIAADLGHDGTLVVFRCGREDRFHDLGDGFPVRDTVVTELR